MAQKTNVRCQAIWLDDEGIVHAESHASVSMTIEDAVESIAAIATLVGGVPRPVLVDIRKNLGITREARQYFAGPETATVESAAALLIDSPLTRALGNFFMGFNKPLSFRPGSSPRKTRKRKQWNGCERGASSPRRAPRRSRPRGGFPPEGADRRSARIPCRIGRA